MMRWGQQSSEASPEFLPRPILDYSENSSEALAVHRVRASRALYQIACQVICQTCPASEIRPINLV